MTEDSEKHIFNSYDEVVQNITDLQPLLYSFICSLISDSEQARDILQEVNLVLWQKKEEFKTIKNFSSWACGVARYQVMAFLRDKNREKHFFFDEQLLEQVADYLVEHTGDTDRRTLALQICLKQLSPEQQALIKKRYTDLKSVKTIAQMIGKTPNAVAKVLSVTRRALRNCISKKMNRERRA